MQMTVDEAIQELESRKAFLMQSCVECWDPAMEMALQALKALNINKVTDARSAAEYEIPDRIDIPELEFKEVK